MIHIILEKLEELINNLKLNGNKSYVFFENIRIELLENNSSSAIEKLKTCYSITQYSNFSFHQEHLLNDILEVVFFKRKIV